MIKKKYIGSEVSQAHYKFIVKNDEETVKLLKILKLESYLEPVKKDAKSK